MNTTDGKAVHITRPAVLTALCCITCLYILLCGKFSVTASVIICFVCTLICCTISFFNDGFKAVIILLLFVSASCIHGVFTYYNVEKQAIDLFLGERLLGINLGGGNVIYFGECYEWFTSDNDYHYHYYL